MDTEKQVCSPGASHRPKRLASLPLDTGPGVRPVIDLTGLLVFILLVTSLILLHLELVRLV